MREGLEGLESRQVAMNGEEEDQQRHHRGMSLGVELESRTSEGLTHHIQRPQEGSH